VCSSVRRPLRKLAWQVLRWSLFPVVLIAIGHRVWLEREKLAAFDFSLDYRWILFSGACYLVGMSACAIFWHAAMRDCKASPSALSVATAYFAGHLGKYVPGKGLVVVIRAAVVKGPEVTVGLAAITCFIETLLMMATGSLTSLVILPFLQVPRRPYLVLIAAGLTAIFGLFVSPPVMSRLKKIAMKPFPNVGQDFDFRLRWITLGFGVVMMSVAWLLAGLSLVGLLASMGSFGQVVLQIGIAKAYALLVCVVALATVGGFVSMIPGGLGTREWILVETLGPMIGGSQAIVAAILLRLVWLVAEIAASGVLWIVYSQWKRKAQLPN